MRLPCILIGLSIVPAAITGCDGNPASNLASTWSSSAAIDRSKYLLAEEPAGAIGVIKAREAAGDGEPVVIVGRVGGVANPWVDGRAAFTLLDESTKASAHGEECAEGEICSDDCCADDRATCTTLVKVVDTDGKVLAIDARELMGISNEGVVVVRGAAKKDDAGNFSVLADGVYVRR